MKIVKKLLPYIIIIIVVVLIRTFIITPAVVDGDSMENTLYDGEIILVNKIYMNLDKLNRYDIVVIKRDKDYVVKRVVGLPGEHVVYKENKLYVDDLHITSELEFEETEDFEILKVPNNTYYVLGDNRDVSKDSRSFGPVKESDIVGKVNVVLFPFNKIGMVK